MTLEFKPFKQAQNNKQNLLTRYIYKPNFVLQSGQKVLGTIFPVREIITNSNSSLRGYTKIPFGLLVKNCILVIRYSIQYAFQSLFFFVYIGIIGIINVVFTLPEIAITFWKKSANLGKILLISDTRDLWLLNLKIDIKEAFYSFKNFRRLFINFAQASYLGIITVLCLSILQYSSQTFAKTPQSSYFSKFVSNYSPLESNQQVRTKSGFNLFTINASASPIQKITVYQVKQSDTLDKISLLYGVSKETLQVNNGIVDNFVTPGQNLYIPWVDGYIHKTDMDSTPEEIATLFEQTKEQIINENSAQFNPETGKYQKDTLILIPTKDANLLVKKLQEIKTKLENERKQKEEDVKRQEILARQAVSASSVSNATSYRSSGVTSTNFIWPTTGSISRCFTSYHRACDIANFSSPPIVAAAEGVVSAVYRYDVYGYGNAVVITHSNGIKTLYAHMADGSITVSKGQIINQGGQIGTMGQTGLATGIHLHFEVVVDGVQSDPIQYLP
jgi:murein DD-endopeptidase MepM/ murein hydrolase activator NlpD